MVLIEELKRFHSEYPCRGEQEKYINPDCEIGPHVKKHANLVSLSTDGDSMLDEEKVFLFSQFSLLALACMELKNVCV